MGYVPCANGSVTGKLVRENWSPPENFGPTMDQFSMEFWSGGTNFFRENWSGGDHFFQGILVLGPIFHKEFWSALTNISMKNASPFGKNFKPQWRCGRCY